MNKKWRQKLHLEPPKGWMNDPNGLCFFKGKYHVFFQYSPDDANGGGRKCWGHYQSENLINWKFTGTVLFPDIPEDKNGVYSGSAYVNGDRMEIFYTGNVKKQGDYDYITSGREANVIHAFTENGCEMSKKTVVLRNCDYPPNCSCHVRDPKVWKENGRYRMVLGARTLDNIGEVLFYYSDNLTDWRFEKAVSFPDFGYMWECPDYFSIDGHKYLSVSPQGLPHKEFYNQNVYSSGYFKYDNTLIDFEEWDYGFDFYAPQTFEAPDNRRIIIGWMGIGDIPYINPTTELGWQHCLTLPREITVSQDGGLIQKPIREIERLRRSPVKLSDGQESEIPLPFDLLAECKKKFILKANGLEIGFQNGIFSLKFTDKNVSGGRNERKVKVNECKDIRIIADISSLEIYLNEGRKVLSTRFYPDEKSIRLSLTGLSAEIYELEQMEMIINGE